MSTPKPAPKSNPELEAKFYQAEIQRLIKEQTTTEFSIFDTVSDVHKELFITDPILGKIKFNMITVAEQQSLEKITDGIDKTVQLAYYMQKRVYPDITIAQIKDSSALKFSRFSVLLSKLTTGFLEDVI